MRDEVGRHQEPVRAIQERVAVADHREQLVQRVDGHELDAGSGVDLGPGHHVAGNLNHAVRPRVAVVDRVREQRAARVEQAEVDAPTVDADRGNGSRGAGLAQARQHVAEDPQRVPVQRAANPDRHVGEAVGVLQGEPATGEGAHDDTAALSSEVDGRQSQGAALSQIEVPPQGGGRSRGPCTHVARSPPSLGRPARYAIGVRNATSGLSQNGGRYPAIGDSGRSRRAARFPDRSRMNCCRR